MAIEQDVKAARTDTRQRILDVGAHLFATRGFAGTSIRDIADQLCVTKAALYYHFTSKEQILQELVSKPILALREVLESTEALTTVELRREFIARAVESISDCDTDVIAVFKDPSLSPVVANEVANSGVTHALSLRLAMGLSGVTDPQQVRPEHLMRAIAAVAAAYEAINNWRVVYPQSSQFSAQDKATIVGFACDILEAG